MNVFHRLKLGEGSRIPIVACALVTLLPIGLTATADPISGALEILTLSTRPDMVSGGAVLVRINMPQNVSANEVTVTLNGRDISNAFHAHRSPGSLAALVEGLAIGRNTLRAKTEGSEAARLDVVNHPITGPIFSGPHQTPFICETATFVLPVTGDALGPSLDADCSIATRVDYVYKSTDGTLKPLPDPTVHPTDLAQTRTTEGRTVNYIVRTETGTINRAIYQIAVLHDPKTDSVPSPFGTKPLGWNERLIYFFGGGCAPGYHQGEFTFVSKFGSSVEASIYDVERYGDMLAKGYAVAASTQNIFRMNCNDVLSAETAMMVKERFIKQYGLPRYTIGWGGSGGSMQQDLIAQNYPGLLDGITPSENLLGGLDFFTPTADCPLLRRVFDSSTQPWTTEQKTAVAGWGVWDYCTGSPAQFANVVRAGPYPPDSAGTICPAPAVPPELIYDPVTNPTGARCTWFDNAVNLFGRDPATGFARRAMDNVGVQYGLVAFNAGKISAAQFLELNERIGGYDIDGNIVAARTVADREALRLAYETGRLNRGAGGLASVPIIDWRAYHDFIAHIHDSVRSHIMRARLIAANGNAANQVILVSPHDGTPAGAAIYAALGLDVLRLMDQWLGNIASDTAPYDSLAEKVVRNKPAELVDACYGAAGEKITDQATCESLYPPRSNPRLAAGEPLTNDILKCELKPISRRDYAQPLTDQQFARLETIFPKGVCDYSRPGVEQEPLAGTWLSYPRPGSATSAKGD
jgi:hypothetical protein